MAMSRTARREVRLFRLVGIALHPACRGLVVAVAGVDPLGAFAGLFELPERRLGLQPVHEECAGLEGGLAVRRSGGDHDDPVAGLEAAVAVDRSEEHTSELQSLMRISYAVFCLKKKKIRN